ncbi:site-specific integrase [Nordella sp. HKS 07]|uniref:tyrosine-type recombinase/integrase n=1 Tax=Nordella sp. HKS 07 TaxID=2712222 RepID=UPI0013E10152|nr:site-specific integrase [Nordella sp. HKS 07]QIG49493.1 site-specific integrase [Nordella sp. HKS 07]
MAKTFIKMTRPCMRKLPANGRINEHGISFERLSNGDGVFAVNIMVDGRRIHRVVGRESDGTTRTQVEEFIAKVRNDAKLDRLDLPRGRKTALSFRVTAERYLGRLVEEGGRDLRMKRVRLNQHLVPFFGDLPLTKITGFDLERYKRHRRGEPAVKSNSRGKGRLTHRSFGAAPGTINRELAVLSHLLNKAIEWRWILQRPVKINRFKEESGRIVYLTVEQIARLVECAKADANPQIYPFIVVGLETSMRAMEILSIRTQDIDIEKRTIYIPNAKAGPRTQPMTAHLSEFLAAHLDALPAGTPWLFPSISAKDGHTVTVRKPFRRVVAAAGLDPDRVVRHTLRHTAITHLVQAGVDLPTVKRISGHKTLAMVERYAHANGEHIKTAMDKLDSRYRRTA